jgi:hypothetical protein
MDAIYYTKLGRCYCIYLKQAAAKATEISCPMNHKLVHTTKSVIVANFQYHLKMYKKKPIKKYHNLNNQALNLAKEK